MASLDDLPLDPGREDAAEPAPAAASPSRSRLILPAALVALALAAGAWYVLWPRATPADALGAAVTTAPVPAPVPVTTVAELPPLAQMDPVVRRLLTALAAHPELLKWLATDDLLGSLATAIDRLAAGESPARDLAVLRPASGFAVVRRDAVTVAGSGGYVRYAPLVDAVTAVDPLRLAEVFVTLRPRLLEAWRAQGLSDTQFDPAVRRAIEVVVTTPDLPADAALVPGTGGYAYADPALERLPAAQKHLLRMGPAQTGRVRDAVRAFGAALGAVASRDPANPQ